MGGYLNSSLENYNDWEQMGISIIEVNQYG
jgi:hypothetical protein